MVAAERAIADAADARAGVLCFPECFVPGYRAQGRAGPPPDAAFLSDAPGARSSAAAAKAQRRSRARDRAPRRERPADHGARGPRDGTLAGFQDKVQLDPSEEGTYAPGNGRRVFNAGALTLRGRDLPRGLALSGDGALGGAARRAGRVPSPLPRGASPAATGPRPSPIPANTFHEKAALCRAAENTCFFATVNYASEGSPTTSAVVRPDGTLLGAPALRRGGPADRGSRHRQRPPACSPRAAARCSGELF